MNEELENNSEVEVQAENNLKKQFTAVTPLSKYLAMALFITLPFVGFWVGYNYAPEKVLEVEEFVEENDVAKNTTDYEKKQFIVPETVSLNLKTTFDEANIPILELRVYAGGGCDKVSELEISKTVKEGTMFLGIKGYSIEEYKGMGSCAAVVEEARVEIDVQDFLQHEGHQIWFRLGDQESRYSLSQNEYAIYLEPVEVTNVISHESGLNQTKNPQSLAIILQDDRFAVLGFNGTYRDMNYTSKLREFAQTKGLVPVDEVFKGFTQPEKRGLWVLADDSQIPDTIPAIIGEITYDSGGWGMENVDITISRKQLSPLYSF